MLRRALGIVVLGTAVLATGCASVKMASAESDAAAKTFAVQSNKANVYIYRNESMGAAVKMPVLIDGIAAGDTGSHTYVLKEVTPGEHVLVSKAENDSTLTINAAAGKNYFVWQEVKMGLLYARTQLHLVDETTGEAGVKECKRVE